LTGGGGAPLYSFEGKPDTKEYVKTNARSKVSLEQIARPGATTGENAYHFVLVTVNGEKVSVRVSGVEWGWDFQPYRTDRMNLDESDAR
jgi:hypothetical protein